MFKSSNRVSLYLVICLVLLCTQSCEKDFTSIDSDVINSDNAINFETSSIEYPIVTHSKIVDPVQSNNLPSFLLGYDNHAIYGESTSSFLGQMVPDQYSPDFGDNVVLDSVVFTIPYFSRGVETSDEDDITYELDSVYGGSPIKLSIYRNNFFLRSFDPYGGFDDTQKYYSNGSLSDLESISQGQLEGELLFEINNFSPNASQINLTEVDTSGVTFVSQKIAPALRFRLDTPDDDYWQNLIFENETDPVLNNENNFKEFFRGLYIKVEGINSEGSMMLLNLASTNTNLTIHYTSDTPITSETDTGSVDEITSYQNDYVINFSGILLNIFDNNFSIDVSSSDEVNGDENIYLKGGEGYVGMVDLFNGTVENEMGDQVDAFDHFKSFFYDDISESPLKLINEAYIEFYVNQDLNLENEPDRIFLYNYEQNTSLIDYFIDQSVSSTTINAKINHLEPLQRVDDDPEGQGIKYKIRITEHLNNIILRDSTNARLGLGVINDIAATSFFSILNEGEEDIELASGTILSHKGTILHGNQSQQEDKRPKIKIYYTEPED
ncbi:MAG: DUF4270 domain-containing protein [Flavobacteriaceae bacterium]|jgi:hypothetical protein|nr:DUF4270 domain-containing protein [Flavobacteriaceae bacterium]MBT4113233.1 DUF4270 domain-containing protein [Flavobacteriaceae bacterium]MBT4614631.1 DUF4270 domain-containing protein [Flavobacteriaceae bacterium]MBT5247138.1 DUF4270 domain-containing protein [Flavobacteriaceae bacterium]MBT5649624.1 DUF4270 domain-containing protein [Flavobacteriaceae bacterium]